MWKLKGSAEKEGHIRPNRRNQIYCYFEGDNNVLEKPAMKSMMMAHSHHEIVIRRIISVGNTKQIFNRKSVCIRARETRKARSRSQSAALGKITPGCRGNVGVMQWTWLKAGTNPLN
ncbi:hypothetical protein AWENTII_012675 [Aspergillus wentii]